MGDAHAVPGRYHARGHHAGRRRFARAGGLLAVAAALALVGACGSKANGVDVCKQVETARCQAAPKCNISITPPVYTSGTAIDACIQFYEVACLDGLGVSAPTSAEVTACVESIELTCDYVSTPSDSPACAWLNSQSDAGAAADAANAPDVADADGAPSDAASDSAEDGH